MITIIHGDDIAKSREYFLTEKQSSKDAVSFDKDIILESIAQITGGGSLFSEPKDIFIENFFLTKKSNPNDLKEITAFIENNSSEFNFVFWEGKKLEKSILSLFKKTVVKAFDLPQSTFAFVDGIKPKSIENSILFHAALKNSSEEILFHMLVRQFRLLIAMSDNSNYQIDDVKRLAPWQKSKLERQSNLFTKEKKLDIYAKLLKLDLAQKSGTLGANLVQSIDIFLSKI